MAQNVLKPRIYLNIPEWLATIGELTIDPVFYTLPVSKSPINTMPTDVNDLTIIGDVYLTKPYVAILGHSASFIDIDASVTSGGVINGGFAYGGFANEIDAGFSIAELDQMPTHIIIDPDETTGGTTGQAGSILLGTFYDFPHSPDLNLSLTYSYDGIKETTTKGGATLTNSFYTKPPKWGTLGAWELGGTAKYAKSGRRVWSLSWSYLSDSSVFPTNAALTNDNDAQTTTGTLLYWNSLQRVIHLTNGGQIPFIFCSDSENPRQDNHAIAKFDMGSFKFDQVANNVYNIKVKIREVW